MNFISSDELLDIFGDKAKAKTKVPLIRLILLSILAGSFVAFGYLLYIKVVGTLPVEWGSIGNLIGGAVFPIGLIAIMMVGGELVTGNMMVMPIGFLQKKVTLSQLAYNWIIVLLGNMIGGFLIALIFGHFVGLAEGIYLEKTLAVAAGKVADAPMVAIISGIGCNIFVGMAVWIATAAKDGSGKMMGMWFPIMAFVAIGFQHVVANAFIIPAAIFSGASPLTWWDYAVNIVVVFIGNAIGGAFGMGVPVYYMYRKEPVEKRV